MFQTEIIIFLQSLASDGLTAITRLVSFLGDGDVMIPLLLAAMLSLHFRCGFFLLHAWIWAGAINGFLKTTIHLPRPVDVDSRVQILGSGIRNTAPEYARGANSFFSPLPANVLPAPGEVPLHGFGFPSGHTACAASWSWLLSRELKAIHWRMILFAWVVLIAFSRIYLGCHFLADILMGLAVGIFVGGTLWLLFGHSVTLRWWLDRPIFRFRPGRRFSLLLMYLMGGPLLMFLVPQIYNSAAARLLGLNLGFLLLWLRGLPRESGSPAHRLARCLLGMGFYALFYWGFKEILLAAGISSGHWLHILRHFMAPFLTLAAGVPLGIHLGVWQR